MLGGNTWIARNLTWIEYNKQRDFVKSQFMLHYTPNEDILLAVHAPLVRSQTYRNERTNWEFGDMQLKAKYQFYRKDGVGKTLRMAAKVEEVFPTGINFENENFGLDAYQTYIGGILGYETLKYGIGAELGYHIIHDSAWENRIDVKAGFGLPLLKPTYPVNQLNLYFEYHMELTEHTLARNMHFTQGIQYAIKKFTAEFAYRHPLVQEIDIENKNRFGIIFGFRYIIN